MDNKGNKIEVTYFDKNIEFMAKIDMYYIDLDVDELYDFLNRKYEINLVNNNFLIVYDECLKDLKILIKNIIEDIKKFKHDVKDLKTLDMHYIDKEEYGI